MSRMRPRPCAAQRVGEAQEALLAAELGVDRGVVDDVVAVRRAGPRRVDRRGIDMADAEPRQIGHDRGRVVEGEVLVELQPVGGARRRRGERRWPRGAAPRPSRRDARRRAWRAGRRARRSRRGRLASWRRQFGCPRSMPGRFGLVRARRATSSNWTRDQHARACGRDSASPPRAAASSGGSASATRPSRRERLGELPALAARARRAPRSARSRS